jgi:hypothetical protein
MRRISAIRSYRFTRSAAPVRAPRAVKARTRTAERRNTHHTTAHDASVSRMLWRYPTLRSPSSNTVSYLANTPPPPAGPMIRQPGRTLTRIGSQHQSFRLTRVGVAVTCPRAVPHHHSSLSRPCAPAHLLTMAGRAMPHPAVQSSPRRSRGLSRGARGREYYLLPLHIPLIPVRVPRDMQLHPRWTNLVPHQHGA